MRNTSLKVAAVAATAAFALTTGAVAAEAATNATHRLSSTSKVSAGTSVATKTFKGGTVTVSVDATGSKSIKHAWKLSVGKKQYTSGSYKENDPKRSWTIKDVPSGGLKLSAPAAKGQVTKITLQWN